jgi:protein TonB
VPPEEEAPAALPLVASAETSNRSPLPSSLVVAIPAKAPALAPQPKRLTPARLIHSVPAEYSSMARQMRAEGEVVLSLEVDATGNVSSARVVSGPSVLRSGALDAVRRWKYDPAILGDKAVPSTQIVKIDFHLK